MSAARKPQLPSPSKIDLFGNYQSLLQGGWQPCAAQARAITRLQSLANALNSDLQNPPKGLWLYGPPGRGKSRLLDMFMDSLPMPTKRRVHFHAFMTELHKRMAAFPPAPVEARNKPDPVTMLAAEIHAEATVLGFDEFYLTNLPDAMFLGRLMQALFKMGTIVVATSNWPLPDLFQGGLNRDRFLPLLKLLQTHLEPIDLSSGPDFRLLHSNKPASTYLIIPVGESPDAHLSILFDEFGSGPAQKPPSFLHARRSHGGALWATFRELCDQAHGRQEYQKIVNQYQTIIVEGVPKLTAAEADSALRLTTLIDIIYEQKRRLVVSAAVPPAEICATGPAAQVFQRTASRLVELTGYGLKTQENKKKVVKG